MAITAIEHAQFAPRAPLWGCVVSDRYIVTMAYNASTSGTAFTDYAVFDTVTQTSVANSFPIRNTTAENSMISANGYAWAIGKNYSTNRTCVARINPVTGGYTLFDISSARGNSGWIYYLNGYFFIGALDTYDAPYDAWSHYRYNATTMIDAGMSGVGWGGNRFRASVAGTGDTLWSVSESPQRRKITASTGVVADNTGGSFPGAGVRSGTSLYSGTTAWNMSTESVIRTLPSGASGAAQADIGSDGLLYSVNATTVVAIDPIAGSSRTETFPVSRAERSLVFNAAGKLWTPSGYPL